MTARVVDKRPVRLGRPLAGVAVSVRGRARSLSLGPAMAVVLLFLVVPLLLMGFYSFVRYVPGEITDLTPTVGNYVRLFGDAYYFNVVLETLGLAFVVTLVTTLLGFPIAYYLARTKSRFRGVLTYLVFMPLMVGVVVRAYGWIVILGNNGLINNFLLATGLAELPLRFLYTPQAVIIGLAEALLPFMVMPILSALEHVDPHVEEAARALGATPTQTFFRVTVPLSMPGLISGSLLVAALSVTTYAIPELLGGARVKMIAAVAYDAMLVGYNWPLGSAIGIFMTVITSVLVYFYIRSLSRGRRRESNA